MAMMRFASAAILLVSLTGVTCSDPVPTVILNNGVKMPRIAIAPMKIDAAGKLVHTILDAGFSHVFTAEDYYNQKAVKAGLAGLQRSSFFITSMTSPCIHSASRPMRNVTDPDACYNLTLKEFQGQLDALGVDAVDLMMLHGPSRPFGFQGPCGHPDLNLAQWRAYTHMYRAGKARAIGVSNYCPSCLQPLLADADTPVPAVNQVQFHVGMGSDPEGLASFCDAHGIVLQAYSPLAQGALVKNTEAVAAGTAHGKTGAQAALRWITQRASGNTTSLVTSASNTKHLAEDHDIFEWDLSGDEKRSLDTLSCTTNPELCREHSGTPSWGCTEAQLVV